MPWPGARDARLLIQVDKDQMSAGAQITADWGGQPPLTLAQLGKPWRPARSNRGERRLLAAAVQAAGEAAPRPAQPRDRPGQGGEARPDTRLETGGDRGRADPDSQELDHGKVDMRPRNSAHRQGGGCADAPPPATQAWTASP